MKIDPFIFRAYDIRGIFGETLTSEIMAKIGFVIGKDNLQKEFVVGNDIRKSGKELADNLIKGLKAGGAKVVYSGTNAFGETLFAGWKLKKYASLFLTGSHLPPEWNGLKLYYGDGEPFTEQEIMNIRDKVIELDSEKINELPTDEIEQINIRKEYFAFLISKFPKLKNNKLKIVLDCGNGSMCLTAPELLKEIGFDVVELYCDVDPEFPNRESQPTFESTKVLRKKVVEENADFGMAFDGDGDRCLIIDEKGNMIGSNETGIVLGKYILKNSEDKKIVIATVSCSMRLENEINALGGEVIRTPVGHTHIILNCKKHNGVFGMETSGHMVMPEYFLFDDALLIPLKLTEIILEKNKKISEIISELTFYPFEEFAFECSDEKKFKVLENLKNNLKEYNPCLMDGLKISFDDGWILIRVSNTSPIIRLSVEATTKEKLDELKEKFSRILNEEIEK